jgi:hypothetical protein
MAFRLVRGWASLMEEEYFSGADLNSAEAPTTVENFATSCQ